MQERGFTEKDWKLFRSKIADWQEAYINSLQFENIIDNSANVGSEQIYEY